MSVWHTAVHLRRHAYVDQLVSLGADVNLKSGHDKETPLIRAAVVGDAAWYSVLSIYMYMYVCMCVCIYMDMYIYQSTQAALSYTPDEQ